ncbi:MAG: 2Fe-2S iron-sulfur cluster-binding protein [Xanthobacteraceae bacterium]
MRDRCTLTVNGRRLTASIGDTLVDAALRGGVVIPHECCGGQCNTCLVTLEDGEIDDNGTRVRNTVLGCQATVAGDAVVSFDEVPLPAVRHGTVASIEALSPDILQVVVQMNSPFFYFPGQYTKVKFKGFPARDYSPAPALDGDLDPNRLVYCIKRYPTGQVSSSLGSLIGEGHKVRIDGPYGSAFLRSGRERLVLVSSGTGWAPIWAIAHAACRAQAAREIVIVAGARDAADLIMRPCLQWLREHGVADVTLTASGFHEVPDIRRGRPTAWLPTLRADDCVHVAGAPAMVESVMDLAEAAGAACHADPFLVSSERLSPFERLARLMQPRRGTEQLTPLSPRPQDLTEYETLQPVRGLADRQPFAENSRTIAKRPGRRLLSALLGER